MLTIQNFNLLEGTYCNGWSIDSLYNDMYRYDTGLSIIEPKCYLISFVSSDGWSRGKILLEREWDKRYKKGYRFELWLNKTMFMEDWLTASVLKDKDSFIQSVVDAFDFELKNK